MNMNKMLFKPYSDNCDSDKYFKLAQVIQNQWLHYTFNNNFTASFVYVEPELWAMKLGDMICCGLWCLAVCSML